MFYLLILLMQISPISAPPSIDNKPPSRDITSLIIQIIERFLERDLAAVLFGIILGSWLIVNYFKIPKIIQSINKKIGRIEDVLKDFLFKKTPNPFDNNEDDDEF